jgi:predicted phosphodiesterase
MRLWAISDLHLGQKQNREALSALPSFGRDWVILAGDVGETAEHLEIALSAFGERFARVIWVPGNHELWTARAKGGGEPKRGLAKYEELVALCRRHGALTPEDPYPRWVGEGGEHVIAPVFVLYDYSFRPDDVPLGGEVAWAEETGVLCTDEHLLSPAPYASIPELCAARVAYTERRLAEIDPGTPIVLVNHYPTDERLVELEHLPRFSIWCGTRRTSDWHLRFRIDTVVYGHMHRRTTTFLEGARFEEVSLGYPRDWMVEGGMTRYLRRVLPAPEGPWEEPPEWTREPPPDWVLGAK